MNKKADKADKKGLTDTFILMAKIKGHATWRIIATGRDQKKLNRILKNQKDQIEKFQYGLLDGITGTLNFV